jgi:hypothetical protein
VTEKKIELPPGVLAVRVGPGANCSSIGSVVDILFGTAVAAGFVYALIATALPDAPATTKKEKDE